MSNCRRWKRIDALVLIAIIIVLAGLVLPAVMKARIATNRALSTSNLQQVGRGFLIYNDTIGFLPHNGGADDAKTLKSVNYGWHDPNIEINRSGTWATQILSFIKQEEFFRNNIFTGVEPPGVPEKYPADKYWQVQIPEYLCTERARKGFKTSREKGCYPGPVTDFAINVFINSQPTSYCDDAPRKAFARANGKLGENGDWATTQSKYVVANIPDGTASTILAGGKALPPAMFETDCASKGDEGIFSPGNWSLKDGKKTLISTGTSRGHVVVAKPPSEDQKEYPQGGGVPWMFHDSELTGEGARQAYELAWGGPFQEGVHFLFCDGSVRILKHDLKGTIIFAHMLYPNDGVYFPCDD